MNISNSLSQILNSIQLSNSEHIVIHTLLYNITPLVKVFSQLSSLTIAYPNIGFNSFSLTLLVPMSANYRPPSRKNILCIFHYSPFVTKCILLEMYMVWFLFLPLLSIHIADLLSNIIRVACSGTTSVSLFNNSLFSIMECDRSIPILHASL